MKSFNEKFNTYTKNSYPFIKLKDIVCNVRHKSIEAHILFDENFEAEFNQNKTAIEYAVKKLLKTDADLSVKFIKSHFDTHHFKNEFLEFCKSYPLLAGSVTKNDIKVTENNFSVSVYVDELTYDYCIEKGIPESVEFFIKRHYFIEILFAFVKKEGEELKEETHAPLTHLENEGGRFIKLNNIDAFIGKPIYSRASYIEDAKTINPDLTLCGTIEDLNAIEYTHKVSGEKKVFYKMRLKDFTGSIEAIFFPYKNTGDRMTLLKVGKEIAIRGSLEPNIKMPNTLTFKIKDISYCTLPKDFKINRIIRPVDTEYRTIFPVKYIQEEQGSFFDAPQKIATNFKDKTIVVFDLETTGTSTSQDKIIEIGAVKIVDGIFTETFSSLVDPQIPIPEGASAVNHIYDNDVKGMPLIEQVLPDFYKFVENATIVAHNLPFDLGFIENAGRPMGIYFENEKLDTLYLSRKTFKTLTHHNLPFLTKHFNISHIAKHRAVDDSIAAAKLLVKIFETMDG